MAAATKKIYAVDLFCGIGGLTYGLRQAGINVKAGIDNDPSCEFPYKHNNSDAEFIHADIHKVQSDRIKKYYEGADVKVLVGCAPCQPFSSHSNKKQVGRHASNKKNFSLILQIARLVEECEPDIVSVENVPGLQREEIYTKFLNILKDLGYHINRESSVVSCVQYGVPQTRKRLVCLASKIGEIDLIPPLYPEEEEWRTVRDFIEDLPPIQHGKTLSKDRYHSAPRLTSLNLKRIKQSKPGGDWRDWDKELISPCHKKTIYRAPYGRMKWDAPAPTITTQFCCYSTGRFGHPKQNRTISLREAALLQTFPESYELQDENTPLNRTQIARHIGNAVPIKLAEAIGTSIRRHVNGQ